MLLYYRARVEGRCARRQGINGTVVNKGRQKRVLVLRADMARLIASHHAAQRRQSHYAAPVRTSAFGVERRTVYAARVRCGNSAYTV